MVLLCAMLNRVGVCESDSRDMQKKAGGTIEGEEKRKARRAFVAG